MRILVIGGGGREHALLWKLKQSPDVQALYAAPGNAGTAAIATNLDVHANDLDGLVNVARQHRIDLTVVGPEEPLSLGLVDRFREHGLAIVGPTQAAARIEGSKAWAKEIMQAAGVPTAEARSFDNLDAALDALDDWPLPVVVKASGLAAGKGVVIATTRAEAESAIRSMMADRALGDAGREILLEEFLTGQEVSVLALSDGETIFPLIPACDYKRIGEGDRGPNTGGMGAYAPVPAVDAALLTRIEREILRPTLAELRRRGIPYQGILYAGLILTEAGPKVLEFNCRLGDPETEVVLPMMRSDFLPLLRAVAAGSLGEQPEPAWHSGVCVAAVVVSSGYPGNYPTGLEIAGLEQAGQDALVFHAGTRLDGSGRVVTAGGRVLTLAVRDDNYADARRRLYLAIDKLSFAGAYHRRDIAEREVVEPGKRHRADKISE